MADGITKQFDNLMCVDIAEMLNAYIDKYEQIIPVIQNMIDEAAEQVFKDIENKVLSEHFVTGNLVASLEMTPLVDNAKVNPKKYGYNIEFKGENAQGIPYAKIANVLNFGREAGETKFGKKYGAIEGTHFIDEAIRPLKGLTNRINQRIEKLLQDEENKQ